MHVWAHLMHPNYDDDEEEGDEEEDSLLPDMMDDDGGRGGDDDDDDVRGGVNTQNGDEDKKRHVGLSLFSSIW